MLGNEDGSSAIDKVTTSNRGDVAWRVAVAEQIMHHAGDPTSCDQGPLAICYIESLQAREYTKTPSAVAQMVTDIALNNSFQPRTGGQPFTLTPDTLRPDQDSTTYRVNKGGGSDRSYAAQLYDSVAINMALKAEDKPYHLERRRSGKDFEYYVVPNNPPTRYLPGQPQKYNDAFKKSGKTGQPDNIPSYKSLIDVNYAVTGKLDVGFVIGGSKAYKHGASPIENQQRAEYWEVCDLGMGRTSLHSNVGLSKLLLNMKADGNWPPIVCVNSLKEPIRSQTIRNGDVPETEDPDPTKRTNHGHTEVLTEISAPDGKLSSLDNHWGKRADDVGKPHLSTDQIGSAIMADASSYDKFDPSFSWHKNNRLSNPSQWKSMKQSWVNDLPAWVSTHQEDIRKGNASDWLKTHPNDEFVEGYIKRHGKNDPSMFKFIADAKEFLKRHPN